MKRLAWILACVLGASVAEAQYVISIGTSGTPGDGSATVELDSSAGGPIQGWSLAVCSDAAATGIVSVGDGSATAVVGAGGGPPAFDTITLFPDGWTVGVVIDFLGCCTLAPGMHELSVMEYDLAGLPISFDLPETTDICFCSVTLGSPAVAIVVVVGGASISPGGIDSCGTLIGPRGGGDPDWLYSGSTESVSGPKGAPWAATMSFSIEAFFAPPDSDTQGFSMGWSHTSDAGSAVAVGNPAPAGDLAAINGGTGPSFFGTSIFPNGWTVGVVYNFLGGVFLQFPPGSAPVVTADYSGTVGPTTETVTISVDNGLGSPPVSNVVVVGGASFAADQGEAGTILVGGFDPHGFIRGDCNDDGIVNIADAVWTLNELFLAGPASVCPAACDSNDDGMVDATDASYTLNYRFLDGPPPPAPFPDCGEGAGPDCFPSSCF